MTAKTTVLYEMVFNLICTILGDEMHPGHISCDFEKALKTLMKIFPNDDIRACWFCITDGQSKQKYLKAGAAVWYGHNWYNILCSLLILKNYMDTHV